MTEGSAVVVYGAGGHGSVVADAARCAGLDVLGFLDDQRPVGDSLALGRVLGRSGWWRDHPGVSIVLAVGDNFARQRICADLESDGRKPLTVVHPRAVVSATASLAPGVVVLALATINPCACIGIGAIINTGAVVEHDVHVGAFAHVSPNATLAGAARLGELSHVGCCACVLPGVRVGERCLVGAGAVVTRDVPHNSVCMGVPARVTRQLG
ncbi:MAG TPA: acetyltransferase [Polyangiaceae bacterium]|nr:acetyltransferase [Polyangiaceae bacterium]